MDRNLWKIDFSFCANCFSCLGFVLFLSVCVFPVAGHGCLCFGGGCIQVVCTIFRCVYTVYSSFAE